jgi:hypothetical protein
MQRIGLLCLILLLSSCAAGYSSYKPSYIITANKKETNGLEVSYAYNILSIIGNDRYASFERDEGIKIVAISIKNVSDKEVVLSAKNFKISARQELQSLDPISSLNYLSQNTYTYLLWSPLIVYFNSDTRTKPTTIPIGIPIGLFNMIRAMVGNGNLKKDLINLSST